MKATLLISFLFAINASAEFRFRINEDLGTLDWGYGEVNPIIALQLMEGLTTSGPHGEPTPAIASHWRWNEYRKTYTFFLKKDFLWSDGRKVCAQDFVDAWLRVLSREFASPYAHYLFDIKNARRFHIRKVKPQEVGLRANGCNELMVSLERPAAYFPALTSHWVLFPIRKDLIEKFGKAWTKPENLAVTGPYILKEWKRDSSFLLTRNEKYSEKPAVENSIQAIVVPDDFTAMALFKQQKLDWVKDLPFLEKARLSQTKEYRSFATYVGYHLGFNIIGSPKSLDRQARCALSAAIDKSEIPTFLKGQEVPAQSILPPNLAPEAKKRGPNFSVIHAQELWKISKFSKQKELDLFFYAKDIHTPLMEWLQGQWAKNLKLNVKLHRVEGKTYWTLLQKNPPQIFLSGTTASYAHPFSFLSEFLTDSPANWGHFHSFKYDQIALAISELGASQKRAQLISKAEHEILDGACAIIPLYFRQTASLVSQKWNGFSINPMTYVYLKQISQKQ